MQIANGTFILSPENHQPVRGVTPAECLIFHRMHMVNANGSPLGEFFIQPGVAQTVDVPAVSDQAEYVDVHGRVMPAKEGHAAETHDRTDEEEIERLKSRFSGNISVDGVAKTAFAATFGSEVGVRLPQTFAEIERIVGGTKDRPIFKETAESNADPKIAKRRGELSGKLRADLCKIANSLEIAVHAQDSKESIVAAIIEADNKPAPVSGELADKSKKELLEVVENLRSNGATIDIKPNDSKDTIIAAIVAAEAAQ
jgi:hypothetical protein